MKTEPVWHVLGLGAIGGLFAAALRHRAYPVHAIDTRTDTPARGVMLRVDGGPCAGRVTLTLSGPADTGPIHRLLVTTKAGAALPALAAVAEQLAPDVRILLLHNGMGVHESVAQHWPAAELWAGTTTEGAWRRAERDVVHAGTGETVWGRWPGPTDTRARPLPDTALHQRGSQDIRPLLWEKLGINCAINALTALERCRNGALLDDGPREARLERLCREVMAVSQAAGYPLPDLPNTVRRVARSTGRNRSSMLQDVLAGRPTEIEHLNGFVVARAREHGLVCPDNQALLDQLT